MAMMRSAVSRSFARVLVSLALVALTLLVGASPAFAQPARPATQKSAKTLQAPRALQKAHADMKHLPVGTFTLTYNTVSRVLHSVATLQGLQPNSTVIVETVQNNCDNPAGVTHRFADMTADANGKALNYRTRINNVAGFPPTNRAVLVLSQPLPNAPLKLACASVKVPTRSTDPNTLEPTLTETLTFGPTNDTNQNVSGTADLSLDGTTLTVNVQAYNLQPNTTVQEAIHLGSCTWLSYVLYDLPPLQSDGNGHASATMAILNVQQGIPNVGWYVGVNYSPTNDPNNSRTVSCGNVNLLLV
jgi:hypothetical protein